MSKLKAVASIIESNDSVLKKESVAETTELEDQPQSKEEVLQEIWDNFDSSIRLTDEVREDLSESNPELLAKLDRENEAFANMDYFKDPEIKKAYLEFLPLIRSGKKHDSIENAIGRMRRSKKMYIHPNTLAHARMVFDSGRTMVSCKLKAILYATIHSKGLTHSFDSVNYLLMMSARCKHQYFFEDNNRVEELRSRLESVLDFLDS